MSSLPLPDALQILAALARGRSWAGEEPIVVGGAVRDVLLGRGLSEIDLVVADDAEGFAQEAAARLSVPAVQIDDRIGVFRLPLAAGSIDIALMAGRLEADLARRDFTINALAYPLAALPAGGLTTIERNDVIDRHQGLADLDARRIRVVGPEALADDPLRALRAVRFAVELGFTIDPPTADGMREVASRLGEVAAERVGAELSWLFAGPDASAAVELMEATGLLSACFPELDAGRGLEQRPHHQYDVFRHSLAALRWLDLLLAAERPAAEPEATLWSGLWSAVEPDDGPQGTLRAHLTGGALTLRLATLLHDLGKPATLQIDDSGRTRFFGHSEQGAAMARTRLRAWRFPERVVDGVALLITEHLRPGQVAAPGRAPTGRALHRFHKTLGEAVPDLCWLFLADSLATAGAASLLPRWPAYTAHVRGIVGWRPAATAPGLRRIVDGRRLMRELGLSPGPAVGLLLAAIDEAAAAGEVRTPAEALALAARMEPALGREERHG